MRLIDADALTEEIEKNMKNGFPANEYLSLYAMSCIAHAPTVDVLNKISDEINKLKKVSDGNKVYVGINDVLDITDKYGGGKDETDN